MSVAVRNGKLMEVIMSSTVAASKKKTPGIPIDENVLISVQVYVHFTFNPLTE
jgi:hypothetical protein